MIRDTSILARQSVHTVPEEKQVILTALSTSGPLCDLDLVEMVNLPISTVTARRNELLNDHVVEVSHKGVSRHTGRLVTFWMVKTHKEVKEVIYTPTKVVSRSFFEDWRTRTQTQLGLKGGMGGCV